MYLRMITLLFFLLTQVLAQNSVSQCALACIRDVSGTNCSQAQWSCLCQSQTFLERTSTCAKTSCNTTEYDVAISAIKQLCAIFQTSLTILPYATASVLPSTDQVFSTVAATSSLASSPSTSSQPQSTLGAGTASSTASASVYPTNTRASSFASTGLTSTTASTSASTSSSSTTSISASSNGGSVSGTRLGVYFIVGLVIVWVF